MKKKQEEHKFQKEVKEMYEKPQMEIIEMEMEGSILNTSNPKPGGGPSNW